MFAGRRLVGAVHREPSVHRSAATTCARGTHRSVAVAGILVSGLMRSPSPDDVSPLRGRLLVALEEHDPHTRYRFVIADDAEAEALVHVDRRVVAESRRRGDLARVPLACQQLTQQLGGEATPEERRMDRQTINVNGVTLSAVAEHAGEGAIAAHSEEDQWLRLQLGERLVQRRDGVVPNEAGLHGVRRVLDLEHASGNCTIRVDHDAHIVCLSDRVHPPAVAAPPSGPDESCEGRPRKRPPRSRRRRRGR